MDRQIIYPAAIPQDTDLLSTNKNALVGFGYALQDILGAVTCVAGLPCTQTLVASLAVLVGAGRIYSLQNIDGTAYGTLAADTANQIVKQGISQGSVTLATPAPVTAGQSIVYLVEASYQDSDLTPVVLPFYNSTNPAVPFSGPGNTGATSNTQRKGTLVLQVKAGIPATTGTQTTPAPDSGFVGLYAVTVANGQATVTSTNIVQLPAPFLLANLGSPFASHLATDFQSVSSTTLADTGLLLTLPVGVYAIEILLNANGVAVSTLGMNLNAMNGTAVIANTVQGLVTEFINGTLLGSVFPGGILLNSANSIAPAIDALLIKYTVIITQAGTHKLQASQHVSSANALKILAGSYMTATKV